MTSEQIREQVRVILDRAGLMGHWTAFEPLVQFIEAMKVSTEEETAEKIAAWIGGRNELAIRGGGWR